MARRGLAFGLDALPLRLSRALTHLMSKDNLKTGRSEHPVTSIVAPQLEMEKAFVR